LFSCKFRQQTVYSDQEAQTPVESVFVPPILGVEEEGKDVYDCLGELYLQGEEIEYEGRKGVKMDLMDALPPLLYVQMRVRESYAATNSSDPSTISLLVGKASSTRTSPLTVLSSWTALWLTLTRKEDKSR
jgi:ubiquitin carboxyl-terminal hydrolase 25/28